MLRRACLSLCVMLLVISAASAVISAALPLAGVLASSRYIVVARIDSVDASRPAFIATVQEDLKGKLAVRRLPVLIDPDEDGKNLKHVPQLLKRLVTGVPMIWFISHRGDALTANAFSNGTWVQILGTQVDKDRVVWRLTHGEPNLRQTYHGTTAELEKVVRDVLAGKAKPPAIDKNVSPGFGPEAPVKDSRRRLAPDVIREAFEGAGGDPFESPMNFAVIPTLGIGGPIAILALLFPTVFGGVLVLFRQWTAFIGLLSINSMLYLLHWWKGAAWFRGTWWNSDAGLWFMMTLAALLCTMWAWRRQLRNLALGADALETPSRTEMIVLTVLTLSCAGFIAGTWYFDPPRARDVAWNLTLVLSGGIALGFVYKIFRSLFEVMIPMATEGVMLGAATLGHVVVFATLTGVGSESGAGRLESMDSPSTSASQEKGPRVRWNFVSEETGMFVAGPVIVGDHVYAAAAHPAFKLGTLYCLDLATGSKKWEFIDGGRFKEVISSPAVADGRVFIGEGFHEDPRCKVYCLDAETGTKRWEYQTASQTEATPVVAGDRVFMGCGNDGFFCFAAAAEGQGKVIWQFPPKGTKGRLLRFGAAAAVDGGKVYVGTGVDRIQKTDKGETAVFGLDAETGQQVWKTAMPLPVWAAPVVAHSQVFVAVGNGDVFSDAPEPAGAVYCLDPRTGKEVWKRDLPNGVLQKPAIGESLLYAGCRDGNCYALDVKTGEVRWKAPLGSAVVASPAFVRPRPESPGCVYVVSSQGAIACLHGDSGDVLWSTKYTRENVANLHFSAAPAVVVREESRIIVIGTGDAESVHHAVLLCLEDRTPLR